MSGRYKNIKDVFIVALSYSVEPTHLLCVSCH